MVCLDGFVSEPTFSSWDTAVSCKLQLPFWPPSSNVEKTPEWCCVVVSVEYIPQMIIPSWQIPSTVNQPWSNELDILRFPNQGRVKLPLSLQNVCLVYHKLYNSYGIDLCLGKNAECRCCLFWRNHCFVDCLNLRLYWWKSLFYRVSSWHSDRHDFHFVKLHPPMVFLGFFLWGFKVDRGCLDVSHSKGFQGRFGCWWPQFWPEVSCNVNPGLINLMVV